MCVCSTNCFFLGGGGGGFGHRPPILSVTSSAFPLHDLTCLHPSTHATGRTFPGFCATCRAVATPPSALAPNSPTVCRAACHRRAQMLKCPLGLTHHIEGRHHILHLAAKAAKAKIAAGPCTASVLLAVTGALHKIDAGTPCDASLSPARLAHTLPPTCAHTSMKHCSTRIRAAAGFCVQRLQARCAALSTTQQ